MNKFYTILAVICLVFSELGASERQDKRLLDRQAINALLGSTKYYGLGYAGIFCVHTHAICWRYAGFAEGVLALQKKIDMEFVTKEQALNVAAKCIGRDTVRVAGKLLNQNMMTAPIYFGSVLAYTKYQQSK